ESGGGGGRDQGKLPRCPGPEQGGHRGRSRRVDPGGAGRPHRSVRARPDSGPDSGPGPDRQGQGQVTTTPNEETPMLYGFRVVVRSKTVWRGKSLRVAVKVASRIRGARVIYS